MKSLEEDWLKSTTSSDKGGSKSHSQRQSKFRRRLRPRRFKRKEKKRCSENSSPLPVQRCCSQTEDTPDGVDSDLEAKTIVRREQRSLSVCTFEKSSVQFQDILLSLPLRQDLSSKHPVYDFRSLFFPILRKAIAVGNIPGLIHYFDIFSVNVQDEEGLTPLHLAAADENGLPVCQLLLEKGAQFMKDSMGRTPLHLFVRNSFKILDETDNKPQTRMYFHTLGRMLRHAGPGKVNFKDDKKATPLHYALQCPVPEKQNTVAILISSGAFLDEVDSAGNTPLSLAILSGQHTAVGILLARGAKITMKCYVNAAKDSGMATLLEGAHQARLKRLGRVPVSKKLYQQAREDSGAMTTNRRAQRSQSITENPNNCTSPPRLVRVNSTSSFYSVTSLIQQPDHNELVLCLAKRYCQLLEDGGKDEVAELPDTFDELRYPIAEDRIPLNRHPCVMEVFEFLQRIYQSDWWRNEQLSCEPGIMSLIYVERYLNFTGVQFHARIYRRLIITSMLTAMKVWEEDNLWNIDFLEAFLRVFPRLTAKDLTKMEAEFLNSVQFAMAIRPSLYTKYYFELRALTTNKQSFTERPLTSLQTQIAERLWTPTRRPTDVIRISPVQQKQERIAQLKMQRRRSDQHYSSLRTPPHLVSIIE